MLSQRPRVTNPRRRSQENAPSPLKKKMREREKDEKRKNPKRSRNDIEDDSPPPFGSPPLFVTKFPNIGLRPTLGNFFILSEYVTAGPFSVIVQSSPHLLIIFILQINIHM